MIRVLLVDDQAMVRAGFRMILETESDITVVGEAGDGRDGRRAGRAQRAPRGVDGRAHAEDGRHRGHALCSTALPSPPRVLILTTFDLDDYVYSALRAGASGFMLKDAPAEQLIDAVRVIAAATRCWRRR